MTIFFQGYCNLHSSSLVFNLLRKSHIFLGAP